MLKKNDVITVQITDNGSGGEGIAKHNGYTLFVKNGVKGDTAEIVVITDSVEERHLKDSLAVFQGMSIVKKVSAIIRVA